MKLRELFNEMTMVDTAVSPRLLYIFLEEVEPLLLEGEHTGDVEEFQVRHIKYQNHDVYGLCTKDEAVCVFKCKYKTLPVIGKVLYVYIMVTKPTWAKKSLSAKLIFFFVTREVWHVLIDDLLSPANKNNLEKIASKDGMSACWYNIKTHEIDHFHKMNGKYKFQRLEPDTNWQILFHKRYKADDEDEFRTEEYYSRYWKRESVLECRMMCGYETLENETD